MVQFSTAQLLHIFEASSCPETNERTKKEYMWYMIVLQQKSFFFISASALRLPSPVFQVTQSTAQQLHVGDVTTFPRQVVVLKKITHKIPRT